MCGRFALYSDLKRIQQAFGVGPSEIPVNPSYNVAPTHPVLVVVQRAGSSTLETMRWGLIPTATWKSLRLSHIFNRHYRHIQGIS